MRALDHSGRSAGAATWPSASPREASPIRTEGSSLLSAALAANFEGFWKLPAGMLAVERGERMTAVRLAPGDGRPADLPPVGLPSLTPVGITAPEMALVDGQAVVSFDLYEAMRRFYFEDFRGRAAAVSRAGSLGRRLYYLARPAIPRRYQLALRRRLARTQARSRFPAWPVDTTLDDLRSAVMSAAMAAAGRRRVPMLGLWPRRARYGVVLRHDVEGSEGVRNLDALRRLEEAAGLRSIWNFVPERYPFDPSMLTDLQQAGHEIGVHGLLPRREALLEPPRVRPKSRAHQRLPVGLGSPWIRGAVGDPEAGLDRRAPRHRIRLVGPDGRGHRSPARRLRDRLSVPASAGDRRDSHDRAAGSHALRASGTSGHRRLARDDSRRP